MILRFYYTRTSKETLLDFPIRAIVLRKFDCENGDVNAEKADRSDWLDSYEKEPAAALHCESRKELRTQSEHVTILTTVVSVCSQ